MRILIEAPILTQSGYGEHSRLVFESLLNHGEIFLSPLQWGKTTWKIELATDEVIGAINRQEAYLASCKQENKDPVYDIQVHVGIANEFVKKAQHSVLVTAGIETDRVSPNWLIKTHEGIDKIIVPSNHAKGGFTETSYEIITKSPNGQEEKKILNCNAPIEVVPYPVKQIISDANSSVKPGPDFKTDFNFLTIALFGPRKNLENQIAWFLKEFKDDPGVGLVLKTGFAKNSIIDRRDTEKHLKNIVSNFKDSKCKIYLLHGSMTEGEINSLYNHPKIKAYLTTTHGEGYGLPIFEAVYNGLPVVATDWSGHLDFLSGELKKSGKVKRKKLFARIDYTLDKIPKKVVWKDILQEGSNWAFPLELSARRQMRNVYKNNNMYLSWAKTLRDQVHEEFEISKIQSLMRKAILEGPPTRHTPSTTGQLVL
jgi:glycosyltransferase involved in cell wall biosynthesis